jgi:hypothetical protein
LLVGKVSVKLTACILSLVPPERSVATKAAATSFGHAALVRRHNKLLNLTVDSVLVALPLHSGAINGRLAKR